MPSTIDGVTTADTLDASAFETMTEAEIARTLRIDVARLDDVAKTIAQSPSSTIEPARRESYDTEGKQALESLGRQRAERGIRAGLELERTLGEGGMGVVRLATQRSLGRPVAVKTLRPELRNDVAALRLLREAWVTGSLEHPNIVPVYDLGLDDDGSPIIVLKRIEGVEWASIIRDGARAAEAYGAADLLEHNLRILVALCNAVSLAHARGVLHRDLKPENVMIGSFGEVYLVDWGIAVGMREDLRSRLPLAADQKEIAGTPCYMAPEMLGAVGTLSERTDVYLLGAILHEILTGEPPHLGTFKQIMASILTSRFTYGPEVPAELAEIAQRAMAQRPEDRYASAEELKQRIEWYLRHRGYIALAVEARKKLAEMKLAATSDGAESEVRERLYHLFAECRFGFRQAMRALEDDDLAKQGLHDAIETVVGFELDRKNPEAAAAALAEIESPPADLVARVQSALRAREAERRKIARLERMHAELDPDIGRRTRFTATVMLGGVWTIAPLVSWWFDERYPKRPYWVSYVWSTVVILIGWLVFKWGRESLSKTAVNRNLFALGVLAFAMQLLLQVGCHLLGVPFPAQIALLFLVWTSFAGIFALLMDPRFWAPTLGYAAGFVALCVFPGARWAVMSACNGLIMVTFAFAWWRPREDIRYFVARRRGLEPDEAERVASRAQR